MKQHFTFSESFIASQICRICTLNVNEAMQASEESLGEADREQLTQEAEEAEEAAAEVDEEEAGEIVNMLKKTVQANPTLLSVRDDEPVELQLQKDTLRRLLENHEGGEEKKRKAEAEELQQNSERKKKKKKLVKKKKQHEEDSEGEIAELKKRHCLLKKSYDEILRQLQESNKEVQLMRVKEQRRAEAGKGFWQELMQEVVEI